jgi:glycosyltransferase involved in cell wall biosynthesis
LPRFSLIVPTIARTKELKILLQSLTQQDFMDYEVILVDQNDDDRLRDVMAEFVDRVPLIRASSPKGACKARNAGLVLAAGEIIAFPDDDCWYPPELLKNIDQWFRDQSKYSILAVGAVDEAGVPSGNRWLQDSCDLHPINVFRTTFCSALFLRREALRETSFDEGIGPGSSAGIGCGDETDLILSILGSGFRGRFDRTWYIGHPRRDMLSQGVSGERAISYGRGMGHVLRKHSLFSLWIGLVSYDYVRGLVVAMRGRPSAASLCFAHGSGLLRGFVAGFTAQDLSGREVHAHVAE